MILRPPQTPAVSQGSGKDSLLFVGSGTCGPVLSLTGIFWVLALQWALVPSNA